MSASFLARWSRRRVPKRFTFNFFGRKGATANESGTKKEGSFLSGIKKESKQEAATIILWVLGVNSERAKIDKTAQK